MLEDFLQKQEIGIILLQEVTRPVFDDIRGFAAYTNIGSTGRGTAVLKRDHIQLTNIVCLPTGMGMAADFQNVTIVKIYLPSGAERGGGQGKLLFGRTPITTAGHPTISPGWRRLQ